MKKIALLFTTAALIFACNSDDDAQIIVESEPVTVDFEFTHNWDGDVIVNADYEITTYTNAIGSNLKLSKLNYLISDITFTAADGTVYDASDYKLITARTGANTNFSPDIAIPEGSYTVSFTFGFDDEDNVDQAYPDLNSADGTWSVPEMLGGGYHYMRMEGKFEATGGTTETFQYHTIRANKHSSLPPDMTTLEFTEDTSFIVDLGTIDIGTNTNIVVGMNVAEWFKNPNTWDLNENSSTMMPKYELQIAMNENGSNGVFNLISTTQD
jgi:MbnP